jgi:uncharacterized protein YbjT (DUF2867 family)
MTRIFVTGGTGYIGSAVIQELLANNYKLLALERSRAAFEVLSAAGAEVHRGDLTDLSSPQAGAAKADGVIHTAFDLDMSRFVEN